MKTKNLIPLAIIIGIIILYFFPNPEENFFVYLGVVLVFVILIVILARKKFKSIFTKTNF